MNILIVHPSFPGQYFYLCQYLAINPENKVVFLAKDNSIGTILKNVDLALYKKPKEVNKKYTHPYLFPATEALRCAVDRGRIIEVNTGAMSRGYRSAPYPGMALLGVLRAMGGRIAITSDCHRAEWIDFGFDRALQMVRACGFDEVWCWLDGGFRAVDISTAG